MSIPATRVDSATAVDVKRSIIPPVRLDTTLHDLFLDGASGPLDESYCVAKPNSNLKYGNVVPLNQKYIIHSAQVSDADDLAHMCLEINSQLLIFYAGPMKIVLLGAEGHSDDESLRRENVNSNANRNFGVVHDSQRPKILTYRNYEDLAQNHDGSKIRWAFAMDFTQELPSIHHADHVYKLNSKRWLASCSLKSANDSIIDCEVKCTEHVTQDGLWYYGGEKCASCKSGMEADISRVSDILRTRPPYVLKLTQSLSSVGTLIVKDQSEREQVIERATEYLQDFLPRITPDNAYLLTTALILSDFVPGETMALNLFVKKSGAVEFLGACHQQSTGESGRQATAITYGTQAELQEKYQPTLDKIGKVLHQEGYYGPVGADIMENPDDGTLFTIDLNVRSPLSMVLYLLRGHLYAQRGLEMSIVYECIMLEISRERFEEVFKEDLMGAKIILLGSTRLGKKDQWAYGVIVAGNSQEEIDGRSDRILEFEVKGGQAAAAAEAAA